MLLCAKFINKWTSNYVGENIQYATKLKIMAISKQATTQKTTAQNSISLSQYGTHPPEFEALVSSSNWEIKKELR